MSIIIYKTSTFDLEFPPYNDTGTLILSTQKMRYRRSLDAHIVQVADDAVFKQALESFYADTIILDLFDTLAASLPETVGSFLDDYDSGLFPDSQLVLVLEDSSLIEYWELEDVVRKF